MFDLNTNNNNNNYCVAPVSSMFRCQQQAAGQGQHSAGRKVRAGWWRWPCGWREPRLPTTGHGGRLHSAWSRTINEWRH